MNNVIRVDFKRKLNISKMNTLDLIQILKGDHNGFHLDKLLSHELFSRVLTDSERELLKGLDLIIHRRYAFSPLM